MHKYNILIVEDEFINAQFIEKAVLKLGHNVIETVETGQEALEVMEEEEIHVVFMDINLNSCMDGIQCAKKMNQKNPIPIIYTTAFSDSKTIDEAMDTNLYGYLIKPYDYHDIEAVLSLTLKQNYLKKQAPKATSKEPFTRLGSEYKYYMETQTLLKNETPIPLTKKEATTFYHLVKNLNQTVTIEYLNSYVWQDKIISSSTIRDTILRLRKKVPNLTIQTVSGLGYRLEK
jgi:DNA-binding response OmpR family regulator